MDSAVKAVLRAAGAIQREQTFLKGARVLGLGDGSPNDRIHDLLRSGAAYRRRGLQAGRIHREAECEI